MNQSQSAPLIQRAAPPVAKQRRRRSRVALIEELEKVTDAVRQAIDEVNRPIAQQLALKVKARNPAIADTVAVDVAAATLEVADKHCFPNWWATSTADPDLTKDLLMMVATKFSAAGLLTADAMGFIGTLVQTLRRRRYQPRVDSAAASPEGGDASAD